jgi:predicted nuclease of restriction endonuclease-like (RecB) superfamily
MEKQPNDTSSGAPRLFDRVRNILESARAGVARTVNTAQVMANWLIGREIVKEEQRGKRRADYGQQLVAQLSERLTAAYGKGWSVQNLFYMKQFYQSYPRLLPEGGMFHAAGGESPHAAILHAARGESATAPSLSQDAWQPGELHAHLSWTHYRTLLRVGRPEARDFYEIEAIRNAWSARELERQINSFLFDRLVKSRDKQGLMRLATRGQEVTKPIDVLKDPMVLEFLDRPESLYRRVRTSS